MRCTAAPRGAPRADSERADARAKGGCLTPASGACDCRRGNFERAYLAEANLAIRAVISSFSLVPSSFTTSILYCS